MVVVMMVVVVVVVVMLMVSLIFGFRKNIARGPQGADWYYR